MTSRILFEWNRENTTVTTDLLVDVAVFENSLQVFEVRDDSRKQVFFERIGSVEKQGMRLLSTLMEPEKDGLVFCFASVVRVEGLARSWRDLGTVADVADVYKFYLDRLVPPEFATIRKTLDQVWQVAGEIMSETTVINLHFHLQVDPHRKSDVVELAKEQNWTITSDEQNGSAQDLILASRINRQYLQALGELATAFVNAKKLEGKLLGFGIEKEVG